jgi:hypothetical protein
MTIIAIVEEAFFESQERKAITNSTVDEMSKLTGDNDKPRDDDGGGDGEKSRSRNISSQKATINQYLQSQTRKAQHQGNTYNPLQTDDDNDNGDEDDDSHSGNGSVRLSDPSSLQNANNNNKNFGLIQDDTSTSAGGSFSSKTGSRKYSAPPAPFGGQSTVKPTVGGVLSSRPNSRASSIDQQGISANNLQALTTAVRQQQATTQNAPIGKRDVPEHLKMLLQNVEKRQSKNPQQQSTQSSMPPPKNP